MKEGDDGGSRLWKEEERNLEGAVVRRTGERGEGASDDNRLGS
jgi:hypothetical protein